MAMRLRGDPADMATIMGVLSVLAGLVVLIYPGISLVVLAVFLAVWLLLFGTMQIALAFQIRSIS